MLEIQYIFDFDEKNHLFTTYFVAYIKERVEYDKSVFPLFYYFLKEAFFTYL